MGRLLAGSEGGYSLKSRIRVSFFTLVGSLILVTGQLSEVQSGQENLTMGQNLFVGKVAVLPGQVRAKMRDSSWRPGCPVLLESLRLLTLTYWGEDHEAKRGHLVVHQALALEVVDVFRELFAARFVVHRLGLASEFGGDDGALMEENVTSAFNCRPSTGKRGGFSVHSYGSAIDINPKWNPYVRGKLVLPSSGRSFVKRESLPPGGILGEGLVVRAFGSRGWGWGGNWRSLKDYQHFEKRRFERDRDER